MSDSLARSGLSLRVGQARNAARRALRHPGWFMENIRLLRRRRAQARTRFSLEPYSGYLRAPRDALAEWLRLDRGRVEELAAEMWRPPRNLDELDLGWSGADELLDVVGVGVRALEPEVVVEVGVALGFTSAVALEALERNGHGHLHSIDLPALQFDAAGFVGRVVPARLAHRWELILGPSRSELPRLLHRVGTVDFFIHDGDHSYASQLADLRTAWPYLRSEAAVVCDDVANPAFLDFAAEVRAEPVLSHYGPNQVAIGMLRKT